MMEIENLSQLLKESAPRAGIVLPHLIVFRGQSHQLGWHRELPSLDLPPTWQFAISPNGWTDEELGLEWLKRCFEPFSRPQRTTAWRLLLLDGHSSHITVPFIQFTIEHQILLLCLPPHTTHILQPLDVGIFGPYQRSYGKTVDNAARNGTTGLYILYL